MKKDALQLNNPDVGLADQASTSRTS